MRYLVIFTDKTHFMTEWFRAENHWCEQIFCVIDDYNDLITYDGKKWEILDRDHL